MSSKKLVPAKQTAAKTIYAAFKVLKKAGGQLPGKEVVNKVEEITKLTDYEKEPYEKSGYIRWQSILHFHSIDCVKAGYLRKNKGIWTLTDEGEKALKLGPVKLLNSAQKAYRKWKEKQETKTPKDEKTSESLTQQVEIDRLEEEALEGLKNHLKTINPYEFQDMVAALLRAMNYHTPFVSPKGKDGGIDVIAYQDPLGVNPPRIKVQVKHMPKSTIGAKEIRGLTGLLNRETDVGLFVTTGHYSPDAKKFARSSHIHVELIDFERFINLWQEYYNKLTDEEKNMLPLQTIYFLGSNE